MYLMLVFSGIILALASLIIIDGKKSYCMAAFGFFTVCYSVYSMVSAHYEMKSANELLDASLDRGECRIVQLEEVSFGANRLHYQCSDGVVVIQNIGRERFDELVKRQQAYLQNVASK